jgi:hypothetical protein
MVTLQVTDLFDRNPTALQLILNTDDLEVVNPLGNREQKHEVKVFLLFYWQQAT